MTQNPYDRVLLVKPKSFNLASDILDRAKNFDYAAGIIVHEVLSIVSQVRNMACRIQVLVKAVMNYVNRAWNRDRAALNSIYEASPCDRGVLNYPHGAWRYVHGFLSSVAAVQNRAKVR